LKTEDRKKVISLNQPRGMSAKMAAKKIRPHWPFLAFQFASRLNLKYLALFRGSEGKNSA